MAPVETPKGLFLRVNRAVDQDQALDLLLNVKMVANTLRGESDAQSDVVQTQLALLQEYEGHYRAEVHRSSISAVAFPPPAAITNSPPVLDTPQAGSSRSDSQGQGLYPCPDHKKPSYTHSQGQCRNPWQPKPEERQEHQPTRRAAQRDSNSTSSHVNDSGRVSKSGPKPKRMNKNWTPQSGGRK
ncbi:hypothetical protein D6D01_10090 [Aureobasidium pullulans]|uniref:Uncharacterized protein n=1 Tax=Aureobasidium pullulans TaxID=5580 RepID=A0A4S9JRC7_AURPU|nr:hypothetical protein D6D01_10090 [Aureobasidium pullulans]